MLNSHILYICSDIILLWPTVVLLGRLRIPREKKHFKYIDILLYNVKLVFRGRCKYTYLYKC